jgi:hypothetical protein
VVAGGFFFRRLEVLNSAAIAALLLLVAKQSALGDSSFQLSFLAIGCIGGLALPWMEATVQPYARALRGWRDATKDVSYEPRPTQLRIDLRLLARAIESRRPARIARVPGNSLVGGIAFSFRVWELLVLTAVLQIGMLPLLASAFHRITFAGVFVNFAAVPLTAIIVPLDFLTLISGVLWPTVGKILAGLLSFVTGVLLHVVQRFALVRQLSYRIPSPSLWVTIIFLVTLAGIVTCLRLQFAGRKTVLWSLWGVLAAAALVIATYPFSPQVAGSKLEVTVLDEVQGEFLWPEFSKGNASVAAKNNDSLVLRLKYRNRTLLLPGDAENQAEHAMLEENSADLHADVLKVGHHGSKNSTTQEFLDAVAPAIAIISSGEDNPYGHPSPELLERLEASRARVLRTDRDGAVHILTDGDRLEISCFVVCAELATVPSSRHAEAPNQNQSNQQ